MQKKIDRITNILRRDDGISGAMSYTEQISWILFLKYLNDYEEEKSNEIKDFDLSAKNPNNITEIEHLSPKEILSKIRSNDKQINILMSNVEKIIEDGQSQFKEEI